MKLNSSEENVRSIIFRNNNEMLKIIKLLIEFERAYFFFNFMRLALTLILSELNNSINNKFDNCMMKLHTHQINKQINKNI